MISKSRYSQKEDSYEKKLSLLLAVVLVMFAMAGCGNTDGPAGDGGNNSSGNSGNNGKKPLIGVCMQNMSSSISVLEADALRETFEPMGYEVQVVDAGDDVSTQVQQVQNFTLMGAEMLVILPCEIETLEDSLLEAREDGIKVVISGGTGSISEDAYDAVSSDDEYVIGMWVASLTKTWVEANMDPNGDWDVAFLSSTISVDAKSRCAGEAQIIEPWLKNEAGEYMNLVGDVVDEANRVENPVYCQMIADRVESLAGSTTEMDISGDNRGVVAGVLTDNQNVRVFIGYNSLISTAGSQYIMDTYPENEQSEFAFFSAGVMGDEYEYLIGSVADGAGTESVFRAACQFGGGDAAATLANLAKTVMTGKEGVDYGKTNPNSIGLYFPIAPELNNGVASLVCFDSPSQIKTYTYDEVLAQEGLKVYWDSANGYNENMQNDAGAALPPLDGADLPSLDGAADGNVFTYENQGPMGAETLQIELTEEGTAIFSLPGNAMVTDVYQGTYTRDGDTVTIIGFTNVDESSAYKIPGLWSFIDSATGDCTITVNEEEGTFTPVQ